MYRRNDFVAVEPPVALLDRFRRIPELPTHDPQEPPKVGAGSQDNLKSEVIGYSGYYGALGRLACQDFRTLWWYVRPETPPDLGWSV